MLWIKRNTISQADRERELEAQYESWQEQTDRACRPEASEGGSEWPSDEAEHRADTGPGRAR